MGATGKVLGHSLRWSLLLLVLGLHLAAALALASSGRRLEQPGGLNLLALPLAQTGLVVLGLVFLRRPAWLTLPLAAAALAGCWYLALGLAGAAPREAAALGWGMQLAAQGLLVFCGAACGRLLWHQLSWVETAAGREARLPRWSLLALLAALLAAAGAAAAARLLLPRLGWTPEQLDWERLLAHPLAGAFQALYTLLMLAALAPRWWIARGGLTVAGGFAVIACAAYEPTLQTTLFGSAPLDTLGSVNLGCTAAALTWLTLLPLRLAPRPRAE